MAPYLVLLVVHVATAVLGVGNLAAIALLAFTDDAPRLAPLLRRLARIANNALGLMLLSGVGLLWQGNWVFLHANWLRLAVVLFIAVGALLGLASSRLKKKPDQRRPVALMTAAACVLVVVLVALMETKPF